MQPQRNKTGGKIYYKDKEYLGGVILPGVKISLNALVEKTAKLPRIEIAKPDSIIGTNTVSSMQAGMYYGYAGSVDNIVTKIKEELGEDATVIATAVATLQCCSDPEVVAAAKSKASEWFY